MYKLYEQHIFVFKVAINGGMAVLNAISDLAHRHIAPPFGQSDGARRLQHTLLEFLLISQSPFFPSHKFTFVIFTYHWLLIIYQNEKGMSSLFSGGCDDGPIDTGSMQEARSGATLPGWTPMLPRIHVHFSSLSVHNLTTLESIYHSARPVVKNRITKGDLDQQCIMTDFRQLATAIPMTPHLMMRRSGMRTQIGQKKWRHP